MPSVGREVWISTSPMSSTTGPDRRRTARRVRTRRRHRSTAVSHAEVLPAQRVEEVLIAGGIAGRDVGAMRLRAAPQPGGHDQQDGHDGGHQLQPRPAPRGGSLRIGDRHHWLGPFLHQRAQHLGSRAPAAAPGRAWRARARPCPPRGPPGRCGRPRSRAGAAGPRAPRDPRGCRAAARAGARAPGHTSWSASVSMSSRRCISAARIRVLTVPCGTPSRAATSADVRPPK